MKGGEDMIKKAAIAAGVFGFSALTAATMAFAQTSTPMTTNTPTVTPTTSPAPSGSVPGGAPETGRGV